MELSIIKNQEVDIIVLLDDSMRIVKPVQDFLRYQRLKGRADNTIKANGRDLKIYWDFLNHNLYSYDEITIAKMSKFLEYLRSSDCPDGLALFKSSSRTPQTINRILGTIHSFYRYCGMMKEIENPILMKDINRPFNMFKSFLHHARHDNQTKQSIFKVKQSTHAVHLVRDTEVEAFSKELSATRDRLILKILYLTGARIGEVLDLQIEDIPYPDSTMQMGVLTDIKSKGKRRNLYLPMFLLEEIDRFVIEERSLIEAEHGYIFVSLKKNHYGKPLTYRAAYEVFNTVKKRTGIFFNFHDLRHTFISRLVESGMDFSVVKIIAGHEQITTTQQYTHISNQYLRESLNKYWKSSSLSGGAFRDK